MFPIAQVPGNGYATSKKKKRKKNTINKLRVMILLIPVLFVDNNLDVYLHVVHIHHPFNFCSTSDSL